MGVDFGKVFSSSFKYAFNAKRVLPYFILNIILLASLLLLIQSAASVIFSGSVSAWLSVATGALGLIILFAVVMLVKLFFDVSITHNASVYWKKEQPLSRSFPIAKKKYWSALGATILVGIIVFLVSMIPWVGWIIALVVSWFFIVILPIIVISNKSAVDSLKAGYNLFMKNKADVFLFWLILLIIGLILFFVSLIPVGIAALPVILAAIQAATSGGGFQAVITAIHQNLLGLTIGGIISVIIFSYTMVFQEAAKTFFYLQKKKK